MEHKTAALIKHDGFMSTVFEQDGTEVYPYDELMEKYISGRVHPDDRMMMTVATKLGRVMEEFRKAQVEIAKKSDAKAVSQKMFKVV